MKTLFSTSSTTKPSTVILTISLISFGILLRVVLRFVQSCFLIQAPVLLSVSLLFVAYVVYEVYWKRRRLPPGPTPLLAAGNMLSLVLAGSIDKVFLAWKQRYGGIFTFWMGPVPMVFVSDVTLMKRYFVKHADLFSHRWRNYITDTMMGGFNGVVQIDGDKWREQRRFSLHVLRDFGVGRALMEDKIMSEVDSLLTYLDSTGAKPISLTQPVAVCVGNIINNMLFGATFAHTDEGFRQLHEMLDRQTRLVMNPLMGLYIVAPWTTNVPLINRPWTELIHIRDTLWAFLADQMNDHQRHFDPNVEATDLTYAYMKEMHTRRLEGSDMGFFSQKQLHMLLLDLFFAGMETTVTTTKWGFLMLMLHPEVQQKAQRELDALRVDKILLRHKPQLTYLNAVIAEIQRTANILPFNLLRAVAEDVEIDGYHFPSGTMVLPQISIAMNDPEHFPDPDAFRPERFIDEEAGGGLKRIEAFLPFSLGKRQCLGESLARAELFLVFANVLRSFSLEVDDPAHLPSRERLFGLTVSPPPYRCVVRRRVCETDS